MKRPRPRSSLLNINAVGTGAWCHFGPNVDGPLCSSVSESICVRITTGDNHGSVFSARWFEGVRREATTEIGSLDEHVGWSFAAYSHQGKIIKTGN